ncbi:hypothetical protein EPUS_00740 [Endocarpon pusillum Z07020]|uniref:Uncharacterized protein n=1 Tax=Endocarpon pusillum (strain Z07020 / HMAS-L-300199) TaxID=1263415 RepID=U1HVA3_ENDPU|nr:uncharacterized protein EPUS_00740 [Endocarpon pusillum Z07020]ERF74610.1 hypothetical protein EPUS_00740 [Endocarpon pusillum Z07020]
MASGSKAITRRFIIFTLHHSTWPLRLSMRRRTLEVPVDQTGLHVEFDLVFRERDLSRIVAYISHPSTMSMKGLEEPRSCSVGKILDQTEYPPASLRWARKYLGKRFDIVIQGKTSIARACMEQLNERQLLGLYNTLLAKEKAADKKRTGDTTGQRPKKTHKAVPKPKSLADNTNDHCLPSSQLHHMRKRVNRSVAKSGKWHPVREARDLRDGRQVQFTANGLLPLQVPWIEDPLRLVVGPEAKAKIKLCGENPTIHSCKTALSSRLEMMSSSASPIPICTQHRLGSYGKHKSEKSG